MPGYRLDEVPGDLIRVRPSRGGAVNLPALAEELLEGARQFLPGADIYVEAV